MENSGTETKTHKFKAEVKQLLDILAHSLYTNREVFVRELISNAADALYKARFESVRGTELYDPELPFEITITLDKERKLLAITDTGIGMTREELIDNIGTIARSGTANFIQQLAEDAKQQSTDLIGRFGVGFYSVFMAAQKVRITTRSYQKETQPWLWESDGSGTYQITPLANAPRGTRIEVDLRDDALEFAEKERIKQIIHKYSSFVSFPIKIENEQVNKITAIWREPKNAVTQEQYVEFFKFQFNRDTEPLTYLHLSSDVPIQFNALVFIPQENFEIFTSMHREHGVSLFARRVLIQTSGKELIPEYLRFLKGVVDTEDLPLNISRETLQENVVVMKIKAVLVKRILSHLQELANTDKEKYSKFWREFGVIFKEGYLDYANREQFCELLRFNSSFLTNGDELTSLTDYVSRLKTGQKNIYYLSATSRESVVRNPHLEIFRQKGIEVLYLYHPIDEFLMNGLQVFKEMKLQSADQTEVKSLNEIPDLETPAPAETTPATIPDKDLEQLCRRIKDILGDKVTEVRISERLTASPGVLANPDGTISAQLQKMLYWSHQETEIPKKILELNGKHSLILNLAKIYARNAQDPYLVKAVEQLFYSALLQDGYMIEEPFKLVAGIQDLLKAYSDLYLEKDVTPTA